MTIPSDAEGRPKTLQVPGRKHKKKAAAAAAPTGAAAGPFRALLKPSRPPHRIPPFVASALNSSDLPVSRCPHDTWEDSGVAEDVDALAAVGGFLETSLARRIAPEMLLPRPGVV
jgi:hypothetical protein